MQHWERKRSAMNVHCSVHCVTEFTGDIEWKVGVTSTRTKEKEEEERRKEGQAWRVHTECDLWVLKKKNREKKRRESEGIFSLFWLSNYNRTNGWKDWYIIRIQEHLEAAFTLEPSCIKSTQVTRTSTRIWFFHFAHLLSFTLKRLKLEYKLSVQCRHSIYT